MGILGIGVVIGAVIVLIKFLAAIFPFIILASAIADKDKK